MNIDTNFCVYLHISNYGDIFYVGHGRENRASCKKEKGRAKYWSDFAKDGFDYIVIYDNLSKQYAAEIAIGVIIRLKEQGHPITNKALHTGATTLKSDYFKNNFKVCNDSRYGLVSILSANGETIYRNAGSIQSTGYASIVFRGKRYLVHRVVYALVHGECPCEMQINHIDGNKLNNNIENLELVTASENAIHANKTGLSVAKIGENSGRAILNDSQVIELYCDFKRGMTLEVASKKYGISQTAASYIRSGKTWKHLYCKYLEMEYL